MSMVEAAICPLCGQGWCGRPCLRDPKKQNALLFKGDGTEKTLHERGLAWDDPPLKPAAPAAKKKPTMVLLKELAKRGVSVTEKIVTKTTMAVTENRPSVTKNTGVTKKGRGRPKSDKALTPAERARRARAKRKQKE
jgi:hypothetical protein